MNDSTLLVTFQYDPDVYRCELRDLGPHGIECQRHWNGAVRQTRRFTTARPAVDWAEERRRAILAGTVEWL